MHMMITHIPQHISLQENGDPVGVLHTYSPVPVLHTGRGFVSLRWGVQKLPCVQVCRGLVDYNWTSCTQRVFSTRHDRVATSDLHHTYPYRNAAKLLASNCLVLKDEPKKLTRSHSTIDYIEEFLQVYKSLYTVPWWNGCTIPTQSCTACCMFYSMAYHVIVLYRISYIQNSGNC